MTPARYTVQVDWDADGDFDQPTERLDADVIEARWTLGLAASGDAVAAPSTAAITLRDTARRYRPDDTHSPLAGSLVPRRKVRLTSTCGGTTRPHFTGWLERIEPRPDLTTVLHCAGVEALLARAEVFLPLAVNQTADSVLAAVLAQVAYPPAISGYWLLGTARLGLDTRLPDTATYASLEAGRTTFAYVGDWADGVSAWDAIRAAVEAEHGLVFVDREGRVVFWNRHHLRAVLDVSFVATERAAAFQVIHDGAALVNHTVITCHPRAVGDAPEVLWTLDAPLALPPGGAREVRARFVDDSGARLSGLDLITPVATTDYQANSSPTGSGTDLTASVGVTLAAAGSSAILAFANDGALPAHLLAGAQLRGTRLTSWGQVDVEAADAASISLYGRRTLGLDLPLLSDPDEADRLARHLVLEGKDPRGRAETVTLHASSGAEVLTAMLARTIGDRLTLSDARTGHQADYHIVGERHTLARGGLDHETTWVLRPAALQTDWRLGVSGAGELGQATRLTY